jgi:enoyl-CoA hydratase/carnithine racemase
MTWPRPSGGHSAVISRPPGRWCGVAAEPVNPAVEILPGPGYVLARLQHPPANPLGPALLDGLDGAAEMVEQLGSAALVISSSIPQVFAAGADIKHMRSLDGDGFAAYGEHMRRVFARIAALPAISIAAIDGFALGGGLELALACDLRIGSREARLGLPEIKLGLIPGAGGTQRLPRIVGRSRALEILLTARQVPAHEAHALGLLDRLVPAGNAEDAAVDTAAQLARASAPAVAAITRCVEAAFTEDLERGIAFEAAEENSLFCDGEADEGILAFVERRPPVFGAAATAAVRRSDLDG